MHLLRAGERWRVRGRRDESAGLTQLTVPPAAPQEGLAATAHLPVLGPLRDPRHDLFVHAAVPQFLVLTSQTQTHSHDLLVHAAVPQLLVLTSHKHKHTQP